MDVVWVSMKLRSACPLMIVTAVRFEDCGRLGAVSSLHALFPFPLFARRGFLFLYFCRVVYRTDSRAGSREKFLESTERTDHAAVLPKNL